MKKKTKKCQIAFCPGKEHCVALAMTEQAPDESDLKNTLANIASSCLNSDEPTLIIAYNQKLSELHKHTPK